MQQYGQLISSDKSDMLSCHNLSNPLTFYRAISTLKALKQNYKYIAANPQNIFEQNRIEKVMEELY